MIEFPSPETEIEVPLELPGPRITIDVEFVNVDEKALPASVAMTPTAAKKNRFRADRSMQLLTYRQ